MRISAILLFCLIFKIKTYSQNVPTSINELAANGIKDLFVHLPDPSTSCKEAYSLFFGEKRNNVYEDFQKKIQALTLQIASKANHKSYTIDMIAKQLNDDIDYLSVKIKRDSQLEQCWKQASSMFSEIIQKYNTACNNSMQNIYKQDSDPLTVQERIIHECSAHYRKLKSETLETILNIEKVSKARGYHHIVGKDNTVHPHYIHALENYALLLSKLSDLSKQPESLSFSAAKIFDLCLRKKLPACKQNK